MDKLQILHNGQQRPASTGVIGDSQSSSSVLQSLGLGIGGASSKAVRPAAKTLMDLIQEDYAPERNSIGSSALYDNSTPVFQSQLASRALERPRTTSPLSSQHHMRGGHDYHEDCFGGDLGGDQRSMDTSRIMNGGTNISDPMSRLNLGFAGERPYRTNNEAVSK